MLHTTRCCPSVFRRTLGVLAVLLVLLILLSGAGRGLAIQTVTAGPVNEAFETAAREFRVPVALLKAICYLEGRLSNNGGRPSIDNGYGCMHLVQNKQVDVLDRAARELGVSADLLKTDLPATLRGGAVILRDDALRLSSTHTLPATLSDWYGAVAAYSNASARANALLYAQAVYTLLSEGFSTEADDGETITLAPQTVQPNLVSAAGIKGTTRLPAGCTNDHKKVDYPQAIDCLLPGKTFDCNRTPKKAPCTYESAWRPTDYTIDQIVVHDIEGTAQSALSVFQNPRSGSSVQYIIDTDGTIYQVVREQDIAYHAGNYWYNEHSIGVEHAGVDATGYRWYNATEYLASAKLTAYLLKKYHLPLNHEQIVSHGTIPSPTPTSEPNHVDPGPYWLWDYYLKLIHERGIAYPAEATDPHIFTLHPASDRQPLGSHGQETSANFNFFSLYNGPSTASRRIVGGGDITDVRGSVEPDISYYYLAKEKDRAGSGATMYKIWYGVSDSPGSSGRGFIHARQVWLAVPRGASARGQGVAIALHPASSKDQLPLIYGQPTTDKKYIIGDAPVGAVFVSAYTVIEDSDTSGQQNSPVNPPPGSPTATATPPVGDPSTSATPPTGDPHAPGDFPPGDLSNPGTPSADGVHITVTETPPAGNLTMKNTPTPPAGPPDVPGTPPPGGSGGPGNGPSTGTLWYEINYNHRQAWVPAGEVTVLSSSDSPP